MRQPTHAQAWHSKKRSPSLQGQRFQLDDTRIWMRLIFWSAREIGLADHKPFWNWFVGFIKHFIAVYEGSAPPYAQESAEWSESVANVKKYIEDGHKMVDVIGYGRRRWRMIRSVSQSVPGTQDKVSFVLETFC